MSLTEDVVDYIASQTTLIVDTDLFIGGELPDATEKSVVVRETPSSTQNRSGLQSRAIQVIVKEIGYIAGETLAEEIFGLFAHEPGLPSGNAAQGVFYVDVINRPALLDRDERGAYIFTFNLLFQKV